MSPHRPIGVIAISVSFLVIGMIFLVPGLALIVPGFHVDLRFDFQTAGRSFAWHVGARGLTIFSLIAGALFACLGVGLWKRRNWARIATQGFLTLLVIGIVLLALPPPWPGRSDAEVGMGISIVCVAGLWYLRSGTVKQNFVK